MGRDHCSVLHLWKRFQRVPSQHQNSQLAVQSQSLGTHMVTNASKFLCTFKIKYTDRDIFRNFQIDRYVFGHFAVLTLKHKSYFAD